MSFPEGVPEHLRRPAIPPRQFAILMGVGSALWAGVGAVAWLIFG